MFQIIVTLFISNLNQGFLLNIVFKITLKQCDANILVWAIEYFLTTVSQVLQDVQ